MKKKILSMLLSMVLTVACFTGCGSNPSSGGETGGAASTEIPKNPEDMYTVTMAVIGNDQEDMDLVEAEMNKILAEKVGAQIDVIIGMGSISAAVTTYVIRCGKTGFGPYNV